MDLVVEIEKQEVPEYGEVPADRQEGIFEGAMFASYEEFSDTFKHWCAQRNVRFTKLHSQTIEGANRWMKPGLMKYDLRLKYKSVFLSCVYADRKPRKGEPTDSLTFRKRGATGCPACIHLAVTRENMHNLVIKKLNTEHNHPPIPIEEYASRSSDLCTTESRRNESFSFDESSYPSMVHQEGHRRSVLNPESPIDLSPREDAPLSSHQDQPDINLENIVFSYSDSPKVASRKRHGTPAEQPNSLGLKPPRLNSSTGAANHSTRVPFVQQQRLEPTSPIEESVGDVTLFQLLNAQPNLDEEDLFCRSLAIKLRTMNPETRSRLKIQIQTLIHNAQFSGDPLPMHSKIPMER